MATSARDVGRSLRLPSQDADHQVGDRRGPLAVVAMTINAIVVAVVMGLYLIASPVLAMATGLWEVLAEIRDTAVRPRPFVGARHGMPFLDPPVAAPAPAAEEPAPASD